MSVTVALFAVLVGYMWFTAGAMFRSAITAGDVASGVIILTLLSSGLFAFCGIALYETARATQRDIAALSGASFQETSR
jgi:hypothetical protein